MANRNTYQGWQSVLFWLCWLLLLGPIYCSAHGAWLIGSLLADFHDTVDVVLALIFFTTFCTLIAIAMYTAWYYSQGCSGFGRLLAWVLTGVIGLPLLSASSALFAYINLTQT